jgi:hypothetical protein
MKKLVWDFLFHLLRKIDKHRLERCTFDTSVTVSMRHFIPDDGQWHHVATSVDYWLKTDQSGKRENKIETMAYVDGKLQQKEWDK